MSLHIELSDNILAVFSGQRDELNTVIDNEMLLTENGLLDRLFTPVEKAIVLAFLISTNLHGEITFDHDLHNFIRDFEHRDITYQEHINQTSQISSNNQRTVSEEPPLSRRLFSTPSRSIPSPPSISRRNINSNVARELFNDELPDSPSRSPLRGPLRRPSSPLHQNARMREYVETERNIPTYSPSENYAMSPGAQPDFDDESSIEYNRHIYDSDSDTDNHVEPTINYNYYEQRERSLQQ